jgi:hypothetical protein
MLELTTTIVYVLKDGENTIFYCGITKRDIETRLNEHLREKGDSKKLNHIQFLKARGDTITIHEIDRVVAKDPVDVENFWVTNLSGSGIELMNGNTGNSGAVVADRELRELIAYGKVITAKKKKALKHQVIYTEEEQAAIDKRNWLYKNDRAQFDLDLIQWNIDNPPKKKKVAK